MWRKKIAYFLLFFFLFTTQSYSNANIEISTFEDMAKPDAYKDLQSAITRMSEDNKYMVTLYSNEHPLPLAKIHSWTLRVQLQNGDPLEDAKIYVHGGMPVHRHGLPTYPRVNKSQGKGYYQVDGVKFSMSGDWEIRFNIKEKHQRDRVIFKITL